MRIGVIGAGAWGTALALVAASNQHHVTLWSREPELAKAITHDKRNPLYLPEAILQGDVVGTDDLLALDSAEMIICAVPTQHIRTTLSTTVGRQLVSSRPVVNVAKGIELGTHLRVSEVMSDLGVDHSRFAVLSGPSHAEEVVRDMPTTVVVAADDIDNRQAWQDILSTDSFRVYTSPDVVGVEICGALKNVIAIAAGIVDGLGLGDNTKAALMTRGLAEMSRFGVALGAEQQTFFGLAGMGDLIVTCDSVHSRNRFVGEAIGKGSTLQSVLGGMTSVAEGVPTTKAALELAGTLGVELPITSKVAGVLFDGQSPLQAIRELMLRPNKEES